MLRVENLYKEFGGRAVLNGVSFSVGKGETLVITGPSGSGKSTALRCINRLIEPDSGTIHVGGLSMCELGEEELVRARRRIGFVFQRFNLIGRLTAVENTALPLVARGGAQARGSRAGGQGSRPGRPLKAPGEASIRDERRTAAASRHSACPGGRS